MVASTKSRATKLFISNLDFRVTDSDICELFSEFGTIKEATVHYNKWGSSLGTGHVVFVDVEDARSAERQYQGIALDGKPMVITTIACPRSGHNPNIRLPAKMRLSSAPTSTRSFKGLKRLNREPRKYNSPIKRRNYLGTPHPRFLKLSQCGPIRKPHDVNHEVEYKKPSHLKTQSPNLQTLDLELEKYNAGRTKRVNRRLATASDEDDFSDESLTEELGCLILDGKNVSDESLASNETMGAFEVSIDVQKNSKYSQDHESQAFELKETKHSPSLSTVEKIPFEKGNAENSVQEGISGKKSHVRRETEELKLFLDGLEDVSDETVDTLLEKPEVNHESTEKMPEEVLAYKSGWENFSVIVNALKDLKTSVNGEELVKTSTEIRGLTELSSEAKSLSAAVQEVRISENYAVKISKAEEEIDNSLQAAGRVGSIKIPDYANNDATPKDTRENVCEQEIEEDSSLSQVAGELGTDLILSISAGSPKLLPDIINTAFEILETSDTEEGKAYCQKHTPRKSLSPETTATPVEKMRLKKSKSLADDNQLISYSRKIRKPHKTTKSNLEIKTNYEEKQNVETPLRGRKKSVKPPKHGQDLKTDEEVKQTPESKSDGRAKSMKPSKANQDDLTDDENKENVQPKATTSKREHNLRRSRKATPIM